MTEELKAIKEYEGKFCRRVVAPGMSIKEKIFLILDISPTYVQIDPVLRGDTYTTFYMIHAIDDDMKECRWSTLTYDNMRKWLQIIT